jgi:hypothetical protein
MNGRKGHEIYLARSVEDIEAAKRLLTAYTLSLEIGLAFQNYEAEFAAMPDRYIYSAKRRATAGSRL